MRGATLGSAGGFPRTNVFVSPGALLPSLKLTSQHPYAEVYIGKPHVWTVDIENSAEVEKAIRSILGQKVKTQEL